VYISIIVIITIIILKGGLYLTTLKYSRQRECIKEYLNASCEHPTADTVYLSVKQEFPNISLGTVYRNLNLLADLGEAVKITAPNGGVHFDGRTEPHYHFHCNKCGRVIDLQLDELNCINKAAGENFDGIIENHSMMFYGTCRDCIKKN
jgi:Fur family peroxide stress response transcriptional regulator